MRPGTVCALILLPTMPDLNSTLASDLADRVSRNAARVHELAAPLSEAQFWHKPFPYGNSFGHLVLHLTGNLSYYIGAQIAGTGYVRDRPREFTEPSPPSKTEALKRFDAAVAMTIKTIHNQRPEEWSAPYTATGEEVLNRLDMVIRCAAHMQHHIGQMIYLGYEFARADRSRDGSAG